MTGLAAARHEAVIVADDDIRYRRAEIERVIDLLSAYDVVRPQNMFVPLPWHARWDTARSLLNRLSGGDWPGTLGVRRSVLLDAGGYSGEVLFENLEMVRTMKAAGGREAVALDLFIARHHTVVWTRTILQKSPLVSVMVSLTYTNVSLLNFCGSQR